MSGKRGRPSKVQTAPTGLALPIASAVIQQQGHTAKNAQFHMRNKFINENTIFLYTPLETLPMGSRDRFLMLCDQMIITLGAETVTMTEVEEIAQLYRDVISFDDLCKILNDVSFDKKAYENKVLLDHFDKLSKQIEKRKENLNIRTKDRKDARDLTKSKTILDLIDEVKKVDLAEAVESLAKYYSDTLDKYQSLDEYMEPKLKDNLLE
jgi:c-di-AMP phosphodiesterase-like protein